MCIVDINQWRKCEKFSASNDAHFLSIDHKLPAYFCCCYYVIAEHLKDSMCKFELNEWMIKMQHQAKESSPNLCDFNFDGEIKFCPPIGLRPLLASASINTNITSSPIHWRHSFRHNAVVKCSKFSIIQKLYPNRYYDKHHCTISERTWKRTK